MYWISLWHLGFGHKVFTGKIEWGIELSEDLHHREFFRMEIFLGRVSPKPQLMVGLGNAFYNRN